MVVSNFTYHLPNTYTGRVGVAVCFPPPASEDQEPAMHLVLANSVCYTNYEKFWNTKQLGIADLEQGKLQRLWVSQELHIKAQQFTGKSRGYSSEKENSILYPFLSKERDVFQRKLAEQGRAQVTDNIGGDYTRLEEAPDKKESNRCIIL